MGFIKRLSNLVSANMHDLLERCENPERLLHQAIRSMEAALRAALAGAAKVVAQEHLLERAHTEAQRAAATCRAHAEAAVRAGDDAAARQALRRQHDQTRQAAALALKRAEASAASRKLRRHLELLRHRLESARRQRDLLIARQRAAEAHRLILNTISDLPLEIDGVCDFDRLARKVDRVEAEAEALAELSGGALADDADAREQEAVAWVERELLVLKTPLASS